MSLGPECVSPAPPGAPWSSGGNTGLSRRSKIAYVVVLAALFLFALATSGTARLPVWPTYVAGETLLVLAPIVAFWRGGVFSWVFLVTLAGSYPALSPLLTRQILGYPFFSGLGLEYQGIAQTAEPVLLSGLACMAFATGVDSATTDQAAISVAGDQGAVASAVAGLLLACAGTFFFAWLAEPGGFVYFSSYEAIREEHFSGVAFAGGAWAAFVCLALYFRLKLGDSADRSARTLARGLFVLTAAGSMVYLLLHGRRSEVLGYAFLLAAVFGPRARRGRAIILGVAMLASMVVIGAIRNHAGSLDLTASAARDYDPLPGGAGNVMIGAVAGYWLTVTGRIALWPGETYWGHILRLPPGFLDLPRPPTPYDHINAWVPLNGGEYFISEPFMNFRAIGVLAYVLIFVWIVNASRRGIRSSSTIRFLCGAIFMALIFRTLWYGLGAIVKGEIVALLVAGLGILVQPGRRRTSPTQGGPRRAVT
jgi:hypothetical protein